MSKNVFSVKSTMYPNKRSKDVDGPWKPTVEEAVKAFAASLQKKGLESGAVYRVFVAERCPESTAPAKDSRGNSYKTHEMASAALSGLLEAEGLRVGSTAR